MKCFGRLLNTTMAWVFAALFFNAVPGFASVIAYTDRAAYMAAVGGPVITDDFESYTLGAIGNTSTLGDFKYSFPATVEPMVVLGGYGGQGLGGPFDVFVGGDSVSLSYLGSITLRAFGMDVLYAPSFDTIPANIYRVRIDDGTGAGAVVGNPVLDSAGGMFFLGLVADPGFEFRQVDLLSFVPFDTNGDPVLVPGYQFDNFAYAVSHDVPEPETMVLVLSASALLAVTRRRIKVRT